MAGLKAIDMPTTAEMIKQQLASGWKTTAWLSEHSGKSPSGIRKHMARLVNKGIVQSRLRNDHAGKEYTLVTMNNPAQTQEYMELERYLQLVEEKAEIEQRSVALVRRPVIQMDETGWFAIVYYSDWHVGSMWTQGLLILKEAGIIARTDGMYCMFGGDATDEGIPAGPHPAITIEQVMPPAMQREVAGRIARLMGSKMKLMISGCHDWWSINAADYNFIAEIAKTIGCPYVGGGTKYYLQCKGGAEYCGVYHHKAKGYSQYNPLHPCVRRAIFHEQDADIICVAHEHLIAVAKWIIGDRMRYMARTSTRKPFDMYASKLGADERRFKGMDVPVLLLHGSEKKAQWVTGIERAANLLTNLRKR